MPAEMGINMNYAEIKYCDIANGPGVHFFVCKWLYAPLSGMF